MLKKISIRELLLLILVIALFLAWRNAVPAWHQLRELQTVSGHIRQESSDVIYVRQLHNELDSQWHFRILVPEGTNYQFEWTYQLDDPETPRGVVQQMDSAPLYSTEKVPCAEGLQFNIVVFVSNRSHEFSGREWTEFGFRGNLINESLFVDSDVASRMRSKSLSGFFNHSNFRNRFDATRDYNSGLHEYEFSETIQLLKVKGKHPRTGIDTWVELNLVPMSAGDIIARKNRNMNMAIGPGTANGTMESSVLKGSAEHRK